VAAAFVAWHRPRHRSALQLAAGRLTFAVVVTLISIYSINAVLFDQAGGSQRLEEIRAKADRWVVANRDSFQSGWWRSWQSCGRSGYPFRSAETQLDSSVTIQGDKPVAVRPEG
jgi:hypothetical protein